jgi:GNAT superfamily N-acetyltransferase
VLLDDPAVTLMVVEEDGELLGLSASGESRDDDTGPSTGEVRSFFVAPGRWGRGVGKELMAAVLDSLRERGFDEAILWSFAANERANTFYESAGFTRDRAERTEEDWANIPQVRYRRPL